MYRTVQYHSGFSSVTLYYREGAGAFTRVEMERVGPGRTPEESRWEARLPIEAGVSVQFYFGHQKARDPRRRFYESSLQFVFVQDGQLFNYRPASKVSDANVESGQSAQLRSKNLNEVRGFRIYLPRGYRQHTERRYPVLYVQDGQNIFDQGSFGSWQAKRVLDRVIARGQVRELIVVAIDSGHNRFQDYVPPEDGGEADRYAKFLVQELKPYIDRNFRTLAGREHTGVLGSSLGGVFSLYSGWKFFHIFSQVAALSGSWWLKNFRTKILQERKRPIRLYLDSGDSGHYEDCVHQTLEFKKQLLENHDFRLGEDFEHLVARDHEHSEEYWSARLPGVLRFMFPAA